MVNLLKNRRTIRSYSNQEVPTELLTELLEVASRAATTGNMQLYSVVITQDQARKEALMPPHFSQKMIQTAPLVLTFCADFNRFSLWCKQRKAVPSYGNIQSFVAAAMDVVIWAQTFSLLAEEKGLGTCYIGTTTYNADQIIDILDLPSLVVPMVTLTLGYPDQIPSQSERLPIEAFIHHESYKEYNSSSIDRLYKEKENFPDNKNFVEINKKETLAQIFTDIRYTKEAGEKFSETFIRMLRKQGFL